MKGKTKVVVERNSPYDNIKVGDTGYIDGYVSVVSERLFAIVVFDNGDIRPVDLYRLKSLEEIL